MANNEQRRVMVASEEEREISRRMMVWINRCPELPEEISLVSFEVFQVSAAGEPLVPGMILSSDQGAYITQRYITGGHRAEYDFTLHMRIRPGNSNDARLTADETLNAVGAWASENLPDLGGGIRVIKVEATARAAFLGNYENGDEDHQIPIKLTYEVV